MGTIKKVHDDELMGALCRVFSAHGFEGSSLALISEETGLKKPSLYHRFPEGKEQMAREVLSYINGACLEIVFKGVTEAPTLPKKIDALVKGMDVFYRAGEQACVMNMFSPASGGKDAIGQAITGMFHSYMKNLSELALLAGATRKQALQRAERIVADLQGTLILCRGINDYAPFKRMLQRVPTAIMGD